MDDKFFAVWLCRDCKTENAAEEHYCTKCKAEITVACEDVYCIDNP